MKQYIKFFSLVLVMSIFIVLVSVGCSKAGSETESKKEINIIGSTSVQPLAEELAKKFEEDKGVKINVQGVGSSAGIQAVKDKTCDIGTSSRELKDEEKNSNIKINEIALDAIAVVVNPKNKINDLSSSDITKIFKGEIKNWKDVGGPNKEIIVVSREDGSGTRGAFDEMLKLMAKKGDKEISQLIDNAIIAEGNGTVKSTIAGKENSIGYVSLGFIDKSVKAISIDKVKASAENVKNKTYPITRPFLMLTNDEAKSTVKEFLDFVMDEEGQKIVSQDYISVK